MKLQEVAESSIFKSMLLKLVTAGQPIAVDARTRTFLSGNEKVGYEAKRAHSPYTWVVQKDGIEDVKRRLDDDSLVISTYKNYAMGNNSGAHQSSLFQMERPIDEHYTIKKIDGVFTIVDKEQEPVEESKQEQHEQEEFILRQAAKKMRAAGLETELQPALSSVKGPYLKTPYAGFSVHTYYDADPAEHAPRWFNAWFKDGRRTGAITNCRTLDEVIKDIL